MRRGGGVVGERGNLGTNLTERLLARRMTPSTVIIYLISFHLVSEIDQAKGDRCL